MVYSVAISLLLVFPVLLFFTYFLHKRKSRQSLPSPPGLPLIGHLHKLGTLPHRSLHKLSQTYGPIMQLRLGLVPAVVVSTAEMAEWFLKTHDTNFANRPQMQASDSLSYGNKGFGCTEYGGYLRKIRRLCNTHLLSASKVDSFMPVRHKELRDFTEDLRVAAESHQVVNISAKVGLLIEKITYQMVCGNSENTKSFNLKSSLQEMVRLAGVFNIADFFPFTNVFDFQGLNRRIKDVNKTIDDFLEMIISEREQNLTGKQEHPRDFIDIMLSIMKSDTEDEEKLDRTDIKATIADMLAAAMESSAATTEWALTELLRHPEVMNRVQEELGTVIGLGRMVQESDLRKLVYLNMVVKETMRLHPVVPLLIPHESIDDITIKGYHIPKRSRLIINVWAIGRDPNAWSDNAEEFYPERFINSDIDVRGRDMKLIPFGSGRRKCPGMELGIRTVHFVLAQVLHCFNFALPDGLSPMDITMTETFGIVVAKASPLLAVPAYRLDKSCI